MPELDLDIAPESIAYEAKEVQLLLSKEIVKQAFAATELRIVKDWKRATDQHVREQCWHKLNAFREFQQELRGLTERLLQKAKD